MELKERLSLFRNELKLIARKDVRDFARACIEAAPDYVFEDCPSSSSGKYHPIEELSGDGTLMHTKKVFALSYELSRALGCELNRDLVITGALLHDMAKQGLYKSGHTVRNHPQIMATLMADVYKKSFTSKLHVDDFGIMYRTVFYHYGPWTERSVSKPMSEYSAEELSVYVADYVSSKRFVHISTSKFDFDPS